MIMGYHEMMKYNHGGGTLSLSTNGFCFPFFVGDSCFDYNEKF